jgi:hypothetical protein
MRCEKAFIQYVDGNPVSYSLVIAGLERPEKQRGTTLKETSFKEAYQTFAAVRKNWNADGTAKK